MRQTSKPTNHIPASLHMIFKDPSVRMTKNMKTVIQTPLNKEPLQTLYELLNCFPYKN